MLLVSWLKQLWAILSIFFSSKRMTIFVKNSGNTSFFQRIAVCHNIWPKHMEKYSHWEQLFDSQMRSRDHTVKQNKETVSVCFCLTLQKYKHLSLLETSPVLFWQLLKPLVENEYQFGAFHCNYSTMMPVVFCLTFRHKHFTNFYTAITTTK